MGQRELKCNNLNVIINVSLVLPLQFSVALLSMNNLIDSDLQNVYSMTY